MPHLTRITTRDARFKLKPGEGADAIHKDPVYSYAVTRIETDRPGLSGTGLAFTVGGGNDLVCKAVEALTEHADLIGRDIEEVMARIGEITRNLSNHHQLRWLGPHKGVVHLALSSLNNALFDLWAKSRGVPLWRLLLDLADEAVVDLLDLSYLEDFLSRDEALALVRAARPTRAAREGILRAGYPGYDTSVGWIHYSDQLIRENARRALDAGFTAMKLKVGSKDPQRDIRRAQIIREAVGDACRVMVDANQQWTLPQALRICLDLAPVRPYWVEEPTHPDDVAAHQTLARAISPTAIAMGEHVPNRIVFKNYMQAQAAEFIQVDAVRVAGVSEFLTVSLMARKLNLKVVPHVGDMGQIHQHLVLFNHVGLGLDAVFLEYIPHLREHFIHPARVEAGVYQTPREPGASADLR